MPARSAAVAGGAGGLTAESAGVIFAASADGGDEPPPASRITGLADGSTLARPERARSTTGARTTRSGFSTGSRSARLIWRSVGGADGAAIAAAGGGLGKTSSAAGPGCAEATGMSRSTNCWLAVNIKPCDTCGNPVAVETGGEPGEETAGSPSGTGAAGGTEACAVMLPGYPTRGAHPPCIHTTAAAQTTTRPAPAPIHTTLARPSARPAGSGRT